MLKTLIGGIAVGLANIIPGVSGGTMMVVLGLFNRVMSSISVFLQRTIQIVWTILNSLRQCLLEH